MTTVFEPAYAKLNLTLDVLGLREDGYHDLQSIMQTVSLQDDIELDINTHKLWQLICDAPGVPNDHRNLAWKAAQVFFDRTGIVCDGLTIRMVKRIPSQAGMGGGSSDAAAVLRALNRHYGQVLSVKELADLGALVGSDVPFCVMGGTVMCEGRGERLRPVSHMPKCCLLICKPSFSMSTPELYRRLDQSVVTNRPDNISMEQALQNGDLSAIGILLANVFDPLVAAEYPLMDQLRTLYMENGAMGCQMSGSGSAFFGMMPSVASAQSLKTKLQQLCDFVYIAEPV